MLIYPIHSKLMMEQDEKSGDRTKKSFMSYIHLTHDIANQLCLVIKKMVECTNQAQP